MRCHNRGQRQSKRKAQRQRTALATVIRTYQGSVDRCGPSSMTRQICAIVSRPKIAPVVMIYAFMELLLPYLNAWLPRSFVTSTDVPRQCNLFEVEPLPQSDHGVDA